ncbi:MAG: AMP-binding protein, partial [Rhodococcus sp. (in: high G+C Gram-positive bacteria)]|uniref:AMP-binding protein n=1 Tax=Rhodococcus sp. TaxID=1831 RepID=UPI003BB140EA
MNRTSFTGNGLELCGESGLYSVVRRAAAAAPDRMSLCAGISGDTLTCAALDVRSRTMAGSLIDRGVHKGDRIAVLGRTGLDWAVIDLAALAIGAIVVPVYPTSSAHQIRHIVADSGAVHFAAEAPADTVRLRSAGAPVSWTFTEMTGWTSDPEHPELERRMAAVHADDPAMIVYTSGTTGPAKGCVLAHRNMYASAANTVLQTGTMFGGDETGQAVTAHALPLAHVFGQTILFACLVGGTRTHLLAGIPDLVPVLPTVQPTFLALVPYALEKIRKAARPLLTPELEQSAVERGLACLRSESGGQWPSGPVTDMLGGRLQHVISGGASLDDTTAGFFAGFGTHILNCYGMTETATAVTVNRPETNAL